MPNYKEIHSFEDCINATGNYGTLCNVLEWLKKKSPLHITGYYGRTDWDSVLEALDDLYYDLHYKKLKPLQEKFKVLSEDSFYEEMDDFIHSIELDDPDYEKKAQEYIADHLELTKAKFNEAGICPVCGSTNTDNINGTGVTYGDHYEQEAECLDCGASWVERYTLKFYDTVDITDHNGDKVYGINEQED